MRWVNVDAIIHNPLHMHSDITLLPLILDYIVTKMTLDTIVSLVIPLVSLMTLSPVMT
jgi:hypothetical protein